MGVASGVGVGSGVSVGCGLAVGVGVGGVGVAVAVGTLRACPHAVAKSKVRPKAMTIVSHLDL